MLEAKRLLAHTGITVTECASRTGFDDSTNFCKFVRTRSGITPAAHSPQTLAVATGASTKELTARMVTPDGMPTPRRVGSQGWAPRLAASIPAGRLI